MRRISLKNIVLLALLTTSLWSCGSNNETGGETPDLTDGNSPLTNQVSGASEGAKTFNGFINEVDKGHFVSLEKYIEQKFGSYAVNNFDGAIYYTKSEQMSDDSSFWDGLKSAFNFDYCTSYEDCNDLYTSRYGMRKINSDDSIERNSTFSIDSELGNSLVKVKSNLVNRMKNADDVLKCVPGYYGNYVCHDFEYIVQNKDSYYNSTKTLYDYKSKRFVFDYSNYRYVVDLNYPLAANPVAVLDKSSGVSFSL